MAGPVTSAPVVDRERRRLEVGGLVQGVGFRPFVFTLASALSLTGSVCNDSTGVVIEIEGDPAAVARFTARLRAQAPAHAMIESVRSQRLPVIGGTAFTIVPSKDHGTVRTLAAPDLATCTDCLRELADPADRRYRHPFISCTNCGPRFTIITALPYDRPSTTMASFRMCPACAREYADPADRRFHAQTIACHACGPQLRLVRREPPGRSLEPGHGGDEALTGAHRMLAGGRILAVKGLGGYHLVCDAFDESAVALLRRRKHRAAEPFAVMVRDLAAARAFAVVEPAAEQLLTGSRRPVVLLPRCDRDSAALAPSVAPGLPDLGMMLPYTPLHALLFATIPGSGAPAPRTLVMTSGNLNGEPIVIDDDEALDRLTPLVDGWLMHDRRIQVPCDDSVLRVVDGTELPIRRSRGYVPLPVRLPVEVPATLAVGADLKNTCAIAHGGYAWLGQHVGDLDNMAALETFGALADHLERLTGVAPARLVADRHPGYRSAAWARRNAGSRPVHLVQHHHAHVAAVMGEHGLDGSEPVIGIAFDGTGYGLDGAIWGGEVLIADYRGFRRFAHLRYVPLPGADVTVQRPYRMALAHLRAAGISWDPDLPPVAACPPAELTVLRHQIDSGFGSVETSSMGRLFDAVAALIGVRQVADYEAQAAIELEGVSRPGPGSPSRDPQAGPRRFAITACADGLVADPAPLLRAIVADRRAGIETAAIGAGFHQAVVTLILDLALAARADGAGDTVALTGGVFQNALLLSGARRTLREHRFTVLSHRQVPPNDGGLALGQVLIAAAHGLDTAFPRPEVPETRTA